MIKLRTVSASFATSLDGMTEGSARCLDSCRSSSRTGLLVSERQPIAMAASPMSFIVRNTFIEVAADDECDEGELQHDSPRACGRGSSMPPKFGRGDFKETSAAAGVGLDGFWIGGQMGHQAWGGHRNRPTVVHALAGQICSESAKLGADSTGFGLISAKSWLDLDRLRLAFGQVSSGSAKFEVEAGRIWPDRPSLGDSGPTAVKFAS